MTGTSRPAKTNGSALPVSGRVFCVLIFALAWFQLAYASHQFEHVAGDLTGPCTVCVQLERLDAAAIQEPAGCAIAAAADVTVAEPGSVDCPAVIRRYDTRAPPAL